MKKGVLNAFNCKIAGLSTFGNHQVKNLSEMREVDLIDDKTGETVMFPADRVIYFFNNPICAANTTTKTFRLSHCGVYAVDKETGEIMEGVWPKTTTQTLMMYRDLFCGEGYTEIDPIAGRPAKDWRAHMEQYQKEKAMRKAGIPIPRKTRTKKAKINEAMLEMLEKEFGLSREAVLAKMAEQAKATAIPSDMPTLPAIIPAEKLTVTNVDYIESRPLWVLLDIMRDALMSQPHEHADEAWWKYNLSVISMTKEQVHEWFAQEPIPTFFGPFPWEDWTEHEHADADWWENNLPPVEVQEEKTESSEHKEVREPAMEDGAMVIDAEYIEKLLADEKKEKEEKKKTTKKTPAKKTPAKKTPAKKTAKKNTKKEAVA